MSRGGDMWSVLRYVMLCVCGMALCRPPWLPWYLGTVEGGGDVLCAYPCSVLEGCEEGVAGIVVCGAFPRRDARVCVWYFAGM